MPFPELNTCHSTLVTAQSRNLNLRRGNDGPTRPLRQGGQFHLHCAPPSMSEQTPKRRLSRDVPDQLNGCWVKPSRHGERLVLLRGDDWFELHIAFEHLPATLVDCPHRGAELAIGVGRYVLSQEVDESSVALQQGKHLDRSVKRLRFFGPRHHTRLCSRGGCGTNSRGLL